MRMNILRTIFISVLIAALTHPGLAQKPLVSFIEYTQDGTTIELSKILYRYDVDINSCIDVIFHPNTLAFDDREILLSPESIRLRKELEELNELLRKARNELNGYVRSIESLRIQLLKRVDPEVEAKFRKKLKEHAIFIGRLLDVLKPIEDGKLLDLALSTSDPLYADVVTLLAKYINTIQEKLHAETASLIQNNELTLRVWCIHTSKGKEPTAIHLNNYDELKTGAFRIIDKVTFARTEEEDRHLQQSIRFHEDLRNLIKDIGEKDSEIRQVFRELRDQFFSGLRDFINLFGTQELKNLLEEIEYEIDQAAESEEINRLRNDVNQLKAEFKDLFSLMMRHASNLDEISRQKDLSPFALFELLNKSIDLFKDLKDELGDAANPERINKIRKLFDSLGTTLSEIAISLPQKLQEKIGELVTKKLQAWIASFSNLERILEKYDAIHDYLNAFKGMAERDSFITTISDEVDDPGDLMPQEILNVAFSEAPPTVVDIPRTNRQENDIYNLYVQIYRKDSPTLRKEYSFRIKKYGTYSKWTGNLIFAKGEWQKSFQPATSVSWILHHKSRPKERYGKIIGGGGVLGNVLNLGIGLNSAVFSTGGEIEYGLGIAITLLNDIVQLGYGINFQKESRRGYFFIGASLFDLLNQSR